MVVATKPGTTVPVKVLRNKQEKTLSITVDELDLQAEQQARQGRPNAPESQPQEEGSGFGLTLQNLSPQVARRLQLPSGQSGAIVTDVDPDSGAALAGIRPGDVIMSINGSKVTSATEAGRELQKIASGRLARLLMWRDGAELFVTVRKE